MGIEWEIPRGLRSFFLGLLFSRSGVKQKETWIFQGQYKKKKDLMQHGKCVLHKVLNSYFFLGSQRMPNFALFRGLEDAEISQKHLMSQGKSSHSQKGNFPHSPTTSFLSLFSPLPVLLFLLISSFSFLSIHGNGQHSMTNKTQQK